MALSLYKKISAFLRDAYLSTQVQNNVSKACFKIKKKGQMKQIQNLNYWISVMGR